MNSDFLVLFEERMIHMRPSPVSPLLLILDGQRNHKGFQGIKFFRNNNVHMLSTRPQDSQVRAFGQNVYESVEIIIYRNLPVVNQEIHALGSVSMTKLVL
jgi:hypothetical protein